MEDLDHQQKSHSNKSDKTDLPCVVQRVEHQLCVRGAAAARADLPLREAPLQDRHAPPRHRLHRPPQVGRHWHTCSLISRHNVHLQFFISPYLQGHPAARGPHGAAGVHRALPPRRDEDGGQLRVEHLGPHRQAGLLGRQILCDY